MNYADAIRCLSDISWVVFGCLVSESSMARAHWNVCISVKWALFVRHVGSLKSPKLQLSIGV